MKIAFCLIIKDNTELDNLKQLMPTVEPYVDSVHITATGEKVDEVEKYVKDNGWDYSYFKWVKDFSKARNYNFSKAPDDADYIFWLDADDQLIGGDHLRDIAQKAYHSGTDAVFFTYWYGARFSGKPSIKTFKEVELVQMRERLLKPKSIVWKGRLHETPVPLNGDNYKYVVVKYHAEKNPIVVLHTGADRHISEKSLMKRMKRNQELLELQLKDEREQGEADPRTLLYLMKIYAESNDEKTLLLCIDMGVEYLQKSGWDQERAKCCSLMATCYAKLREYKEGERLLVQAIGEYPEDPLLYLHLARIYSRTKQWSKAYHWLQTALKMDLKEHSGTMSNLLELQILSTELTLDYYLNGKRNTRKAYEAAVKLNELNPTEQNKTNVEVLFNLRELDIASGHVDNLIKYVESIGKEFLIPKIIESLPLEISKLPFAQRLNHKFSEPKTWGDKEICYFANFGGSHFEKWGPDSLKTGIGGSETAVINLTKHWASLGYKVTVYGDPPKGTPEVVDGVRWLSWYSFNRKDKFNIFIQWRNASLAKKISAKKFLVDLHDVAYSVDLIDKIDAIDKIMVKSKYHRHLLKEIPDDKFTIISNGI